MAYTTVAAVKTILRISGTTHDTELSTLIDEVDDYIDARLRAVVSSVPLSSTPDLIERASAYLAAAAFLRTRPDRETGELDPRVEEFQKAGERYLNSYIAGYKAGATMPVPTFRGAKVTDTGIWGDTVKIVESDTPGL